MTPPKQGDTNQRSTQKGHFPVMIGEVLENLPNCEKGLVVDMTFGGGGYTQEILEKTNHSVLALDRDPTAIARGEDLKKKYPERLFLVETVFSKVDEALVVAGLATSEQLESGQGVVDGVVMDLGVSSFQLDQAERGFSFRENGPLDMRMGAGEKSAADVVAEYDEKELADIFWRFGEEKLSRRMAGAIVAARAEAPITETKQLVDVLHSVRPRRHFDRTDPATKVFQALRIEVNDELGEIERALDKAKDLLKPGGVLVVVSFHSLEDRIAKNLFTKVASKPKHVNKYRPETARDDGFLFELPHRGVVKPTKKECETNARSRSAKMRVLKKKQGGE